MKSNTCFLYLLLIFIISGCGDSFVVTSPPITPTPPTYSPPVIVAEDKISSNDILIVDTQADAIIQYSENYEFKGIIYDVPNNAESMFGIFWDQVLKQVITTVNGADRVVSIKASDLANQTLLADINLVGTPLRGLVRLSTGEYLVAEDSTIEKFSASGIRVSNATWPLAGVSKIHQLNLLQDGGFISCSSTPGRNVNKHNSNGSVSKTKSFVARALDVVSCLELKDKTIAVVLNHATINTNDIVEIYSEDLSTLLYSYSDYSVFISPAGIVQKKDSNLLISDNSSGMIVEITSTGDFVGYFPYAFGNPGQMVIVP